jgi:hypothetical protein
VTYRLSKWLLHPISWRRRKENYCEGFPMSWMVVSDVSKKYLPCEHVTLNMIVKIWDFYRGRFDTSNLKPYVVSKERLVYISIANILVNMSLMWIKTSPSGCHSGTPANLECPRKFPFKYTPRVDRKRAVVIKLTR